MLEQEVYEQELAAHNALAEHFRSRGLQVPVLATENLYFDALEAVANFNPNHGEGGKFASTTESLEHTGHELHTAHELHEVAEALGGGHDVHSAVEAASHVHDLHDVMAIGARHALGEAVHIAAAGIAAAPGGRRVAEGITALHDKCCDTAERLVGKLQDRYGHATAAAILGSGAVAAAAVRASVGLSGPTGKLIPGQKFIGAIPIVALAEAGRAAGFVGPGTSLEKHCLRAAKWVHAMREAVGAQASKFGKELAEGGLKVAHASGKLARKAVEWARNESVDIDKAAEELVAEMYDGYAEDVAKHLTTNAAVTSEQDVMDNLRAAGQALAGSTAPAPMPGYGQVFYKDGTAWYV